MTTEPKKPETPVADAIDRICYGDHLRPGHDVTDGATGQPYSQAGEKSAGQLLYEKQAHESDEPWHEISNTLQAGWEFNATVTPKNQTIKAP